MLRREGELCTSVSGGLDSTSVTATAARALQGSTLRTYTVAPPLGWDGPTLPNWDADESPLIADLAEMHPNLDPVILREVEVARLFTLQEELWEIGGAPFTIRVTPCG